MISSELLSKIKKQLAIEKVNIERNLTSLRAQDPFSDPDRLIDNAASDAEANEETSHDRVEAIERELHLKLEDIKSAIGRIEEGKYGICQNCGKKIDIDRLLVKPTAIYDLECEKSLEK